GVRKVAPRPGARADRSDPFGLRSRPLTDIPPGRPRRRVGSRRDGRRDRQYRERPDEAAEAAEVEVADERIDQSGEQYERRETEPHDVPDGDHARAEREQQRQLLEAADPPAVTSDQPDRGERERIEGRRPR